MSVPIKKEDLLFPDLSFQIVGAAFDVYNKLGPGLQERTYQRAFAKALQTRSIPFKEQVYVPVQYQNETVGSYYLDLVIDGTVAVELKSGDYFNRFNIEQVVSYLKAAKLKLAILLNFARSGVRQKRIINE